MDNLTHSLVGAAIGRAGARRTTPLATAALVLAANVPDVDMLSYARGEYFGLAFRRGLTHGVPALLLWPWVVAGAMLAWDRWVRRRRHPDADPARFAPLAGWAAVGVLTHPVLDWMNTYGMRWWLPFDGRWSYGDALFIVDPWIWLVLGGAVFLAGPRRGRGLAGWIVLAILTTAVVTLAPVPARRAVAGLWLAGVAVLAAAARLGRPSTGAGRRRVAASGLAVATAYIALMAAADLPARRAVERAARGAGLQVQDVMVAPLPGTPLSSAVEVRTPDGYVPGTFRWSPGGRVELRPADLAPHLMAPPGMPPAVRDALLARARREADVRHYLVWSRYPRVLIEEADGGWRVRFTDARYDDEPRAGGLAGVEVWLGPGA